MAFLVFNIGAALQEGVIQPRGELNVHCGIVNTMDFIFFV